MAGHVRKVGENKYRIEYMLDGQRYSKNIKATSDRQAEKILAQFVTQIENGTYQENSDITFFEFSQFYIDNYARVQCRPVTVKGYIQLLNNRILDFLGSYKLHKITPIILSKFYKELVNEQKEIKLKDGTKSKEYVLGQEHLNKHYNLINGIFSYAIKMGKLKINPNISVPKPKTKKHELKRRNFYTPDELKGFVKALDKEKNIKFTLLCKLGIMLGLRRAESFGLNKNSFLDDYKVWINTSCEYVAGEGKIYTDLKTTGSDRILSSPEKLYNELLNYVKKCTSYYLFDDVDVGTLNKWLKKFTTENGFRKITSHELRHSNATFLLGTGTDLETVKNRLGHTDISTTNIYLHLLEQNDQEASKKTDEFFA